jgi:NADPH:quinone reductase-like Zn-dependent oxidoreductase
MEMMRAVRVTRFGGPEALVMQEVPRPRPAAGEVLVRVEATAINPIDWKLREGRFPNLALPFTPGGDFCGAVEAVGEGVEGFQKGDSVYGVAPGSVGAEAEFVAVPLSHVSLKPRSLGPVEAASVPLAGMTAWQGLFQHGRLQPGQTVLILGASGGVGSFAVQLAKKHGAAVIGTASSRNVPRVRRLGADRVIDYRKEKVEETVKGVDLILDLVGGELQKRAVSCLKSGGRLVSAVQPPDEAAAQAAGVTALMFRMTPDHRQLRELAARLEAGDLTAEVAKILPLEKAAEAEELNRRGEVDGKIVLQIYHA